MSRGFVKEEDQEETPLVTPRAFLPPGVDNYVTANGLEELKQEQLALVEEQKQLIKQSKEINRVQINYLTSKLGLLEGRLYSAKVVDVSKHPQDEVRFGAVITLTKMDDQSECQYQVVGVDEANVLVNKISFLSPIAKVLRNRKVGDTITLKTPTGERVMTVKDITYII